MYSAEVLVVYGGSPRGVYRYPHPMTEDHDPEFDAVVEELQRAGFVTIGASCRPPHPNDVVML
jgi:hypothetical protein